MDVWRSTQNLNTSQDWAKARRLQEQASLAEADLLSGGVSTGTYSITGKVTCSYDMLTSCLGGRREVLVEQAIRIPRRSQASSGALE